MVAIAMQETVWIRSFFFLCYSILFCLSECESTSYLESIHTQFQFDENVNTLYVCMVALNYIHARFFVVFSPLRYRSFRRMDFEGWNVMHEKSTERIPRHSKLLVLKNRIFFLSKIPFCLFSFLLRCAFVDLAFIHFDRITVLDQHRYGCSTH